MKERQKMIETTATSAKRTMMGAEFRLDSMPRNQPLIWRQGLLAQQFLESIP
jgi:hypothetical protein